MRIALFAAALLIASRSAHGATAYEALRVLGKQKGEAVLDNTTEVHGANGKPQPAVWKIVVKDPAAKGGIKEYSIQGTRMTGEEMPVGRTTGSPMNMSQLNLDSDGVHQLAEREAKKVTFGYDHADYRLRAGSRGGSPVWEVRLVDGRSGEVATMSIAATNGSVLSSDGFTNRRKVAKAAPVAAPPSQRPPTRIDEDPDAIAESPGPSGKGGLYDAGVELNRFGDKVGKHFEKRGQQIGDFFYNLFHKDKRDTVGREGSDPDRTPPPPSSRTTRDTDVASPSRVRD
jgi:hypothetical protein